MIQGFEVKDFKCHEGYNRIKTPGLTIISGTNNSGKSSLIQAIYLSTQHKGQLLPILALNDELKLGGFTDILNKQKSIDETIEFSFDYSPNFLEKTGFEFLNITLTYTYPMLFLNLPKSLTEQSPVLSQLEIQYKKTDKEFQIIHMSIIDSQEPVFFKIDGPEDSGYCKMQGVVPESIIYTDRNETDRKLCSRDFEIIRNYLSRLSKENIKYIKALRTEGFIDRKDLTYPFYLGLSGEYTAEIMYQMWNSETHFKNELGQNIKFSNLFELWTKRLLGDEYRIRSTMDNNKDLKYIIKIEDSELNPEFNLNQVGTGISQILPILTLIFTSKEHDIILIENPEVHLHPQLQALFVDLCLFAIVNNRKLVIETHSEHIINRLRYLIKENPAYLEKINILFLEKIKGHIRYTEVHLSTDGTIDYWPENFFDQSYKDLIGLIK